MVKVVFTNKFENIFKKIDASIKAKANKQIKKIIENPEIGKPLRYNFNRERTVYVKPFRIIYSFDKESIYFLRFDHRKRGFSFRKRKATM